VLLATSNTPADAMIDQSLFPAVVQTLIQLFVEPVYSLEAAYAILRAELELLGFKKEDVAGFLTNLEKVCLLFGATSGALKKCRRSAMESSLSRTRCMRP